MNEPRSLVIEQVVTWVLTTCVIVVLVLQVRLLYDFPQPDSARWWGDETGQMLELRAELQDGYARIPTGIGSSVAITNGLVRGNSWLAALLFGVPSLIFATSADLVSIGRTVTFVCSILLLFVIYRMLRGIRVSPMLAVFALLLLVTTRSFFFASHAARLDVVAGVALLGFVWYLATRFEVTRDRPWMNSPRWFFLYGAMAVLFATLSIHLLALLFVLSLYMLWRSRIFRNVPGAMAAMGGAIVVLALLLSIYALSGAPVTMFGPSIAHNQFQSVAGGLPILRPFSRSVQVANILERLHGLWSEAPAVLLLFVISIVISLFRGDRAKDHRASWLSGAAIVIALAWLLLESPALYYYMQVLPLFVVALIALLASRWRSSLLLCVPTLVAGIILCYLGTRDALNASSLAETIARDNNRAIEEVTTTINLQSPNGRPTVLAQNPAIARLEHDTTLRLMTAHFISFPIYRGPIPDILRATHVGYIVLYASHDGSVYSEEYGVLRPIADRIATPVLKIPGTLFDVHRDYFKPLSQDSLDTLILYSFPYRAR